MYKSLISLYISDDIIDDVTNRDRAPVSDPAGSLAPRSLYLTMQQQKTVIAWKCK